MMIFFCTEIWKNLPICKFDLNSTLWFFTAISWASNKTCNKKKDRSTERKLKQCCFLSLGKMEEIASLSQLQKSILETSKLLENRLIPYISMFSAHRLKSFRTTITLLGRRRNGEDGSHQQLSVFHPWTFI